MGFEDDSLLKGIACKTGAPVSVPPPPKETSTSSSGSTSTSGGGSSSVVDKPEYEQVIEHEPGTEVTIKWTDKAGRVKSTATTDPNKTLHDIQGMGGRVSGVYARDKYTGATRHKTYDVSYDEPTTLLPKSIEREYVLSNVKKEKKRKEEWESNWSNIEWVKKHGHSYNVFGSYPSINDYKKMTKTFGVFGDVLVGAYAKSGKAGQPIKWESLKSSEPALELRKTKSGSFETYLDTIKWEKERIGEGYEQVGWNVFKNPKEGFIKGLSEILTPLYTYGQMALATVKGDRKRVRELKSGTHYMTEQNIKEGNIFGLGLQFLSSPIGIYTVSKGLGAGIGALKATSLGSKPLLVSQGSYSVTRTFLGKTITQAGAPLYTVTSAKLIEGGIASYAIFETGRSLKTSFNKAGLSGLKKSALYLGVSFPLAISGYRSGHHTGMGWVQRHSAMSQLSGVSRVRQQGLYESMDEVWKMREPRFKLGAYDIRNIQRIDSYTASKVWYYILSEKGKLFFSGRPRFGGSSSIHMQLPEGMFRTGNIPKNLRSWAITRQTYSSAGYRPLIGKQPPGDIDLLVLGRGMKTAAPLKIPHKIDVHMYKPGEYYWGGYTQLRSTKTLIADPFYKGLKVYKHPELITKADAVGMTWVDGPTEGIILLDSSILGDPSFRTTVLKHEMVHQWGPKLPEKMVLTFEKKPFFPKLEKAASEYFKTGELIVPKKVLTLSLKEQFLRKTESILPSSTARTGYRSYKDIPDWYDIAKVFRSMGGKKLNVAIEKVVYPERFPVPKKTIGEYLLRDVKLIEPKISAVYGSEISYSYPSYATTPGYYTSLSISNLGLGYTSKKYTNKFKTSPYKTSPSKKFDTMIPTRLKFKKQKQPQYQYKPTKQQVPSIANVTYKPTKTKTPPYIPLPTEKVFKTSENKDKRRRKLKSDERDKTILKSLKFFKTIEPKYRFRMFKSSKVKYVSPFKNRRSIF